MSAILRTADALGALAAVATSALTLARRRRAADLGRQTDLGVLTRVGRRDALTFCFAQLHQSNHVAAVTIDIKMFVNSFIFLYLTSSLSSSTATDEFVSVTFFDSRRFVLSVVGASLTAFDLVSVCIDALQGAFERCAMSTLKLSAFSGALDDLDC